MRLKINYFSDYKLLNKLIQVKIGNSTILLTEGKGNIKE
jgi:hypothetical protein